MKRINNNLLKKNFHFLKNQNGQGALEYIIISSLIGIACLTIFNTFGKTLKTKIESMNQKVNKVLDMRRL